MPEAINCDPAAIAAASKCFCFPEKEANAIIAYLLAQIAGDTSTPAELARKARCFCFGDDKSRDAVIAYLLCQIANSTPSTECGGLVWGPNETTMDLLVIVNNNIIGASVASMTLPTVTSITGVINILASSVTSFSAPALVSVGNFITITPANLASVSFPSLTTVATFIKFQITKLTSLSLPSLVTALQGFTNGNCTLLTTVSLPVYLPTNGSTIEFSSCALTASSVNHILARCIANPAYVSGTVNLNLGTNSAPSGQGLTDKADLITRGVTVNTN
jgi:hypothetical protein